MANRKRANQDGVVEYQFSDTFEVTEEMKNVFDDDGVVMIRNLLDKEELKLVLQGIEGKDMLNNAWDLADGEGRAARMLLWNQPGNDVTGLMARTERMAGTCEKLMGGEVYHYHTKLMMKEAKFGGKLNWHQDYGYWYKNGNLKPDMLTIFMPLDDTTKENGCLQIVPRSHKCGRIDHDMIAGQTVTNQERVDQVLALKEEYPHLFLDMNAGDAVIFHSNVLHRSDANLSDKRRWAFSIAYNMKSNNPVVKHHHGFYTPIDKVGNDAIKKCTNFTDFTGKDFMDPTTDKTVRATLLKPGDK